MTTNSRATTSQNTMTSDDLRCMICTKTTKFSDISHLLTHISSKQHLSNYFKIRVAADEDANSQNLLNRFNSWFEQWNMGVLLRERLHQKEKKKAGARAVGRKSTGTGVPAPLSTRAIARGRARSNETLTAMRRAPMHSLPRMSNGTDLQATYNGMPIGLHYNAVASMQPLFPPVPGWSTSEPQIKREPDEESSEIGNFDIARSVPPAYFLRGRGRRNIDHEFAAASSSLHSSTPLEEATEEEKDMAKLKGIIWPGMDLFDSATPEMQRKRNQKKTTNVVAQLQAASLTVEADELIFNTGGDFLKLREITGDPTTINTPLKGETTPEPDSPEVKKKRGPPRRNREALQELDENAPAARRATRRKRESKKKKHIETHSDEYDDELTYQTAKHKKKNGIRIHRDDSGPDITFENQPISMPYLTSGFGYGGGFHKNTARRDHHDASRPVTPLLNGMLPAAAQFRQIGFQDGTVRPQSPAYDLSAFGQMTNFLQPSIYQGVSMSGFNQTHSSLPSLPSFQQSFANEPHLAASQPHMTTGVNGFGQTLPSWDVFHGANGNIDRFPAHHSFSGFTGFDLDSTDINPLFLHSDQAFLPEVEQLQASNEVAVKQEEDADKESIADTISLASDQK